MLAELGDVEFGVFDENGILTISTDGLSNLLQDGSAEGVIVVTGITLVQDAIEISIEAADVDLQAALDGISGEISTVIEDPNLLPNLELVLDTTGGGAEQEVYESVQELQETLQNEETPSQEQIEELFENFQEMDDETQNEFLETFADLMDQDVLAEYEGFFGDFTEDDLPVPE